MLGYEILKFLVLSVVSTNLVFPFFSTLLSLCVGWSIFLTYSKKNFCYCTVCCVISL